MYLKAFDDSDNEIALSANSAILLPAEGEVGYANRLAKEVLKPSKLHHRTRKPNVQPGHFHPVAQKMGAEIAESKRLGHADSDSLLSIVSKDLEKCLQNAIDIAAAYVDMEAPRVL